jgi:hypothetical protein
MSSLLSALDLREIGRFTPPGLDRTIEKSQYIWRSQMSGKRHVHVPKNRGRASPEAMHGDRFLDLNAADNHSPSPPQAAMSDNP